MQLITENFPTIGSLKKFQPSPDITVPQKSVVVRQKVLFRDEKYTDENIRFFGNTSRIVNSLETHRYLIEYSVATLQMYNVYTVCGYEICIYIYTYIFVGDQCTCKNIRGGKRWSETEIEPLMRLQWANEVPGK